MKQYLPNLGHPKPKCRCGSSKVWFPASMTRAKGEWRCYYAESNDGVCRRTVPEFLALDRSHLKRPDNPYELDPMTQGKEDLINERA